MTVVTLWWLFFWTALGLCVGSFLNVVIYRLPRDRSLRRPLWSACPYCRHRIRWYDNLPVISFILLGGRCRDCYAPIATRYLVIEMGMALIVLVLLDAFFVGQARSGLSDSMVGLNDRLAYDWPIFLAHVILFAGLLSMSAIDLEHYWVDVRFTNLATVAGFALHTFWMPKRGAEWIRPFDTTAVMAIFAVVGLAITWIMLTCQPHEDPEDFGESAEDAAEEPAAPEAALQRERAPLEPGSRVAGWAAGVVLLALLVGVFLHETEVLRFSHIPRALAPLVLLFGLIVSESTVLRESDQQIIEAINEERHTARRMVLAELALLLPALAFALAGLWMMRASGDLAGRVHDALHTGVEAWGLSMTRSWSPLEGLATAATGYVIAGAVGWSVRIVFTLVFGREAFGSGDIHLMAAAGCVAGWPVVLLGFFLTCGLALFGWILSLPFKRTRALPLGPWLSLSFLTVVVFYDPIIKWPIVARTIGAARMLFLGNSQVSVFEVVP